MESSLKKLKELPASFSKDLQQVRQNYILEKLQQYLKINVPTQLVGNAVSKIEAAQK